MERWGPPPGRRPVHLPSPTITSQGAFESNTIRPTCCWHSFLTLGEEAPPEEAEGEAPAEAHCGYGERWMDRPNGMSAHTGDGLVHMGWELQGRHTDRVGTNLAAACPNTYIHPTPSMNSEHALDWLWTHLSGARCRPWKTPWRRARSSRGSSCGLFGCGVGSLFFSDYWRASATASSSDDGSG